MVGIRCILSDKLFQDKCQIYVRATITRTYRPMIKTDIYVLPRFFRDGVILENIPGRVSEKNRQEVREARTKLDLFCKYLESLVHNHPEEVKDKDWLRMQMQHCRSSLDLLSSEDSSVGLNEIQQVIDSGHSEKALYDYIDDYVLAKNLSNRRADKFRTIKRILLSYELFEIYMGNEQFRLLPSGLDADVITSFQTYCLHRHDLSVSYPRIFSNIQKIVVERMPYQKPVPDPPINNISQNTCIGIISDLRGVVNWLISKSVIIDDPFAEFTIKERVYSARPVFINIEERKQLSSLDLSKTPKLQVQRDIFIFHCLVGCRYGDLVNLTADNVVEGKFLQYVPDKTKNTVNHITPKVPLTVEAKSLIEKYEGKDKKGRLFPFASNTHYNNCLKKLFTLAGLTRTVQILNPQTRLPESVPLNEFVSSHLARRTFIGNLYNKIKDPSIISVMSGHVEHSRAFSRYRDIGDDVRRDLIDKIK